MKGGSRGRSIRGGIQGKEVREDPGGWGLSGSGSRIQGGGGLRGIQGEGIQGRGIQRDTTLTTRN